MSDEQGHPQRMPDPGTPFPMLPGSSIALERSGQTDYLRISHTSGGTTLNRYYNLGGAQAAAVALFVKGGPNNDPPAHGNVNWFYSATVHSGHNDLLAFTKSTTANTLPGSPESVGGKLSSWSKQSNTVLRVGIEGVQETADFTLASGDVTRLNDWVTAWTAAGGALDKFKAWYGKKAVADTSNKGWSMSSEGAANELTLTLLLGSGQANAPS
jgi:hypothetical protein